jgi:hypothetical protein
VVIVATSYCQTRLQKKTKTVHKTMITKKTSDILPPTDAITLDGLGFDLANSYVKNIQKDPMSSDEKTSMWFSAKWVTNVRKLLDDEGADGFRIYFAKKENGDNTIVVVSTVKTSNSSAPSKANHMDYFIHQPAYLATVRSSSSSEYQEDHIGDASAATLYKPASDSPCTNDASCIITLANHRISCSDALAHVANFKKENIDTRCEWYPIWVLDALDDELTAAKNIGADGVRVYFAKDTQGQYPHSFILATTKTSGAVHKDYYECHIPEKELSFITNKLSATDHGEECPINCTTALLPQP